MGHPPGSRKPQVMHGIGLATVITAAIFAAPSYADRIPGTPFVGRNYYASKDTAPVAVHFVHNPGGLTPESASEQPTVANGRIPRGLIIFANPYNTATHPILPGEIWASSILLYLHVYTSTSRGSLTSQP